MRFIFVTECAVNCCYAVSHLLLKAEKERIYLAKIPKEIHLFHSHKSHSCCRANDKHWTTRTSTERNKLPEIWILRKRSQVIHPHGCSNKWNIVYNCWCYTNDTCNEVSVWNIGIKIVRQLPQNPCCFQASAKEEQIQLSENWLLKKTIRKLRPSKWEWNRL